MLLNLQLVLDMKEIQNNCKKAESYLKSTGIGDTVYFGPEPEFFVFDSVNWKNSMEEASFKVNSEEGTWSSNIDYDGGNLAHRPLLKVGISSSTS